MSKQLSFIDLFSGAGGFTSGFVKAGFKCLGSFDNLKPAIETHEMNYQNIKIYKKSIYEYTNNLIKKIFNNKKIDLIIGGPPCQGFSSIGKKKQSDIRNNLIFEFARFVKVINPKFFVMENVSGLTHPKNVFLLNRVIKFYKSYGYNITYKILNSADYGVPQIRKRFFLIGYKKSYNFNFPKIQFKKENYRNVGSAIMDLVNSTNVSNHIPMKHNKIVQERISYIKEGGGITKKIPKRLLKGSRSDFKNNKLRNFSHIYKRLDRKLPSGTMVPGHNAFPLHPTLNRSLTVREAARLQTFPDNLVFKGTRQEQCILVGNAVPVLLAKKLAHEIKKSIFNSSEFFFNDKKNSL